MMKNLYVVAIGGSGERVMRSLIMLLASGVQVNAERVIPVFIENDIDSHALKSCLRLLKYYNNAQQGRDNIGLGVNTIYNKLGEDSREWPSFCRTVISDPIMLNQAGDTIGTLADVIGRYDRNQPIYDRVDEERNLLFTDDDLNMQLTVGFVGNPNIGSVVLNSLSLSDTTFENIKTALSPQDGVMVVGSLFGGTGAAGLPLLVNSINELPQQNRPILGTIALLPYFVTNPNDNRDVGLIDTTRYNVQSDAFDAKTRAALMYYAEYMTSMDCMYYVGDSKAKDVYPHCVGGDRQDNRAHLVELMSALSIVDFSKQVANGNTNYKRPVWGINDGNNTQSLPTNLSGIRNKELARALVKFRMMIQLFRDHDFLDTSITEKNPYVENLGFKNEMRKWVVDRNQADSSVTSWGLNNLIFEWEKWMNELGDDDAKRKFRIYDDNNSATDKDLTTKFYCETGFGIAKTEWKGTGFLGMGEKKEFAIAPDIQEALASVYRRLYPKGSQNDALKFRDEERLPRLLQIISKALDDVIDNKCIDILKIGGN